MDNAQKAIMIGVGLFITIIIISVVLLITTIGTDMANTAQDRVGQMDKTLQNQLGAAYDNKVVTGAEVKALYDQYKNTKTFYLVFEIGSTIYYNDDGYNGSTLGLSTLTTTGPKYYSLLTAGGSTPSKITTAAFTVATTIKSSDQYKTYLIYDSKKENVIGVYADQI